ncbi:unnamed protein product [Clonostachys byssicola]|uniref:Transmembrane protein n=1 Tax=Clonostachys byssicola TaxID=160290 RepID=A0A9N9U7R3_9HYPO|nr:unnamed protein product [Clonostachys byssicola]
MDDDYSDLTPFMYLQVVDLVLLCTAVVVSLAGIYFAFTDLPRHAATAAEIKVRPRATALSTSLLLVLGIVPWVLIAPNEYAEDPNEPDPRFQAIRYIGAVIGVLDAVVAFLVMSFLIRLIDFVHRPTADVSSSSDSPQNISKRLIQGLKLAVALAITNAVLIIFVLPKGGPWGIRDWTAADTVVLVVSIIIHLIYLVITIVVLVRTRKRTSRGPLLAVAIMLHLRYIYAFLSPFSMFAAGRLLSSRVIFKFVTVWGIVEIILVQCAEAVIVLVLIKVLAYHLANRDDNEEHEDPARRPLLSSESAQTAGTFNA